MSFQDAEFIKYIQENGENTTIFVQFPTSTLHVPMNPANRHYAEIMRQVEAGELVIQEADAD